MGKESVERRGKEGKRGRRWRKDRMREEKKNDEEGCGKRNRKRGEETCKKWKEQKMREGGKMK